MPSRLLKTALRVPGVGRYLAPAWFDEARLMVQGPVFARLLAGRPLHGRVLNAGSGEGLYAPFIEAFAGVRSIVNMDVNLPQVAQRRQDVRHRDQQGSLDRLPFARAVFDGVICSEVLEHVARDGDAIDELARVIKPGGTLLMSVPTPPAPFDRAHVREGYTLADLTARLEAAGFGLVASERCLHGVMRACFVTWQWQHRAAGRNLFPRALLRAAARLDRARHVGTPWDLVVVAVRNAAPREAGT